MCHRDLVIYRQCNHQKSMVVTPCVHGYNSATQQCNINTRHTRVRHQPFPKLCPPCYQEVEEQICDRHDKAFLDRQTALQVFRDLLTKLESNIGAARRELMVNTSLELRFVVEDHEKMIVNTRRLIEQRKGELERNREERKKALKEFRDSQGVWGDG